MDEMYKPLFLNRRNTSPRWDVAVSYVGLAVLIRRTSAVGKYNAKISDGCRPSIRPFIAVARVRSKGSQCGILFHKVTLRQDVVCATRPYRTSISSYQ
jgi:hypothetical protein